MSCSPALQGKSAQWTFDSQNDPFLEGLASKLIACAAQCMLLCRKSCRNSQPVQMVVVIVGFACMWLCELGGGGSPLQVWTRVS